MDPSSYVDSYIGAPYRIGKTDCVSFASKWVKLASGIDPVTRDNRKMFRRFSEIKEDSVFFAVLVNRAMRGKGFKKTQDPQIGDMGLVITPDLSSVSLAILAPYGWVFREKQGVSMVQNEFVWKAWAICR